MRRFGVCTLFLVVFALRAAEAPAQARQNLTLARVIYSTTKTRVKPAGELKERIDAIDREMTEASRLGRTGEVRRLIAKGLALLGGKEWTPALEFAGSLVLRAEEVFVDSSAPFTVRLEQIYVPRVELAASLGARATLHKAGAGAAGAAPGEKVKDLAVLDGMGRDFLDEPLRLEVDLADVADGPAVVQVELSDSGTALGSALLPLSLQKGLRARLQKLEAGLREVKGFDHLRADVQYPGRFIRSVNEGRVGMGTFQVVKELEAAEGVLASLRAGKDPFAGRTGDMERHHLLDATREIMPYRVFVPKGYTGRESFPLIVALHGLGGNEDSFFDSYGAQFPKLAGERGYIVVAPLGYRVDGAYGASLFRSGDPATVRKGENSERDVMAVLGLMRKHYRIDPSRIYLTGHSMGAIGTWYLGAKYPDIWAALAPFAGFGVPSTVAAMKHIPQIVVHGDADPTVAVGGSRAMVAEMRKLGVEHRYIEVPGGNHIDVVMPNFGAVLDFFDGHRKAAVAAAGR